MPEYEPGLRRGPAGPHCPRLCCAGLRRLAGRLPDALWRHQIQTEPPQLRPGVQVYGLSGAHLRVSIWSEFTGSGPRRHVSQRFLPASLSVTKAASSAAPSTRRWTTSWRRRSPWPGPPAATTPASASQANTCWTRTPLCQWVLRFRSGKRLSTSCCCLFSVHSLLCFLPQAKVNNASLIGVGYTQSLRPGRLRLRTGRLWPAQEFWLRPSGCVETGFVTGGVKSVSVFIQTDRIAHTPWSFSYFVTLKPQNVINLIDI